jgi:hypothetical protein
VTGILVESARRRDLTATDTGNVARSLTAGVCLLAGCPEWTPRGLGSTGWRWGGLPGVVTVPRRRPGGASGGAVVGDLFCVSSQPDQVLELPDRYAPLTLEGFAVPALAVSADEQMAWVTVGLDVHGVATGDPYVEPLVGDHAARCRRVAELSGWVCAASVVPCAFLACALVEPHEGRRVAFAWITEVTGPRPYCPPPVER